MDCEKILFKIQHFIQEKIANSNANGVILGLSGGIDSALVATLCKKALKDGAFALLMPTKHSSKTNLQDALKLCETLNLNYKIINIDDILQAFLKEFEGVDKIRTGNCTARIRMNLLYDYSALKNYLVVGTSNKSELMLGYGTIYGDLAYAFNPIGGLYKSEIYTLAKYLNLDEVFLKKVPSADLWENQSDEEDLGFSYALIDEGLKALEKNDEATIAKLNPDLILMLQQRIKKNAFKREMPQILRLDEFL
ncbi:NAD+ synthase [Campylobacter helveticus]|uniref:NAD+ synthase n=1 Tax=Campylobacter helveticus TaxID=28898 RepID=UPI00214A4BF0|nr:NAD+ synthase [Campylobacter helveticus]MCR2056079.1 NAD+ synthase [Campylobacter helveticus]